MNSLRANLASAEDTASKYGCGIDIDERVVYAAAAALVGVVATYALPHVPRRVAVRAKVRTAEATRHLRTFPGATVRRERKEYVVTFPDGTHLTCAAPPDVHKAFPVSNATGEARCQTKDWQRCKVRAAYEGTDYTLEETPATTCEALEGTERTYYYGGGTLAATNTDAYLRAGLHLAQLAGAYGALSNGLRAYVLPYVCTYDVPKEVADRCPRFAEQYMQDLRLDLAGVSYQLMQKVGGALGGVAGEVVGDVGKAAAFQNEARAWWHALRADVELWRCASRQPDGTWPSFLLRTYGAAAVALAVGYYAGKETAPLWAPHLPKGRELAFHVVGAVVGVVAAEVALLVLRGTRRTAIGLTFLDPRMAI